MYSFFFFFVCVCVWFVFWQVEKRFQDRHLYMPLSYNKKREEKKNKKKKNSNRRLE